MESLVFSDPTEKALTLRTTWKDGSVRFGTLFPECRRVVKRWDPDSKFLSVQEETLSFVGNTDEYIVYLLVDSKWDDGTNGSFTIKFDRETSYLK